MHSILKLRESDPHDVIPAAWADKVLADMTRESESAASDQQPPAAPGAAAAAPAIDTTFRAGVAGDIHVPVDRPRIGKWTKSVVMLIFGLGSAAAAAAWQHHGDAAKQMIADWTPSFALTSSPPPQTVGLAGQPDTPAVQTAAADQAPPSSAAPAQPAESVAPAATTVPPDTAQLQSMARDVAAMGHEIEQLKAGIAELRAGQQAMAKVSEAKPSEIKSPEVRTSAPTPRPKKLSALSPRPPVAALRKPAPAYSTVPAAAPRPLPQPVPPPALPPPAPPPQANDPLDDGPVVRPPMPLR